MPYTTIATSILSLLIMTLMVKNVMLFSINNQSRLQKLFIVLADLSALLTATYFFLIVTKRIFSMPYILYTGGFSFACYSIFPTLYLLYTTKPIKKKLYSSILCLCIFILIVANSFLNEFDFIKRVDLVYMSIPSHKSVILLFLQVLLTMIISLLGLKIIQDTLHKVERVHSSIQKFQFSWLTLQFKSLIIFSITIGILFTIAESILFNNEYVKQVSIMTLIYLVVLITTFGCLRQAPITEEEIDISNDIEEKISQDLSVETNSEDLEEYEKVVNSVIKCVKDEKLYLNADLKLNSLSEKCEIPSYLISRAVNFVLNKNFNEFINDFRIIESKRKLSSPDFDNVTILAIALESGFNSKSSFNAQFKKRENITPNEYRSTYSSK